MFKQTIFSLLNDSTTKLGKTIRGFIISLILLSSIILVIEFAWVDLFHQYYQVFYTIELIVVIIFALEYIAKLWSAPNRLKFIINFYSIIDLLAILPFFLGFINSSIFRSVRIIRLLRVSKLFRLTKIINYFWKENTISVSRIIQENIIKNIIVLIGLYFMAHPIAEFFHTVDLAVMPDILLATSVLAVAAMFGFFSLSYGELNLHNTLDRFLIHLTTGMLMFPIGMMFLIVQVALTIELGRYPTVLVFSIWLVYAAIVLWDFWNVRRVEQKLKASA